MKDIKTIISHILGIIAFLVGVGFLIYENEFTTEHSTIYVSIITGAGLAVGFTIHQLYCDVVGCCQYCDCSKETS